jgi:hypothetical protein
MMRSGRHLLKTSDLLFAHQYSFLEEALMMRTPKDDSHLTLGSCLSTAKYVQVLQWKEKNTIKCLWKTRKENTMYQFIFFPFA